ncbi:MAG TPA: class I SAM-dependent methyltransferase [Candidatus Binatia bacterium]|nr:class I SAM-dependent methyltransferase [Candidatus Binatia bacterium]
MSPADGRVPGSFRDPNGFVFRHQGRLYRQIGRPYRQEYEQLIGSGLYRELSAGGLLIRHEEVGPEHACSPDFHVIIRPALVPFISYPYEWAFGQLRDAALLTLKIQKLALEHGMSLKDASAYNIQYVQGKPLLIDTLSFETYAEGRPWVAYRQFCQHFLAPLALMARRDVRLGQLSRIHLDGVPIDLASRLLPRTTHLRFSLLSHIHLHARSQRHYRNTALDASRRTLRRFSFLALIDSLESAVAGLRWQPRGTEWADYYEQNNYTAAAMERKGNLVDEYLRTFAPRQLWDIGANTGQFSRLAATRQIFTVSLDIDPAAVELNYRQCRREDNAFILPLLGDITNPSPGIGWANRERMSLLERGPVDAVLALALVHHLAIGNNLPFSRIAQMLSGLCRALIIEFIPKEDSQVQRLLSSREDVFPAYHVRAFEEEFSRFFSIARCEKLSPSDRSLYLLKNKSAI